MSEVSREVLYRFMGEVDQSLKKSLNEVSQLAAKAQGAKGKAVTLTTRASQQAAREEMRVSREMRKAEISENKRAQADLKLQQRDAQQFDRAKQKAVKDQQRAASQAARAQQQAQSQIVRGNRMLDRSLISVASSALSLARGFAIMGLAGEENSEKMLRGLLKVEGGFEIVRSSMNLATSAMRARQALGSIGAAGGQAAGTAAGAAAGGAAAGRFFAGSLATKAALGVAAVVATTAAGKIISETIRDSLKYGIGGGYRPGSWGGAVGDAEAGMATAAAGAMPNWMRRSIQTQYPFMNPFFNAVDEASQTKRMQGQRSTAMTGARMRAVRAYEGMQMSSLRAQEQNTMLDLYGGEMPIGQLTNFAPGYRKFASMGYRSAQDVQRTLISQRDLAQTQARLPALRQAEEMTGADEKDWQNYASGVAEYDARIKILAKDGATAAESLREMSLAAEEFNLTAKNKSLALALQPPGKQLQINEAMKRISNRTATRKDILKAAPYTDLTPGEETWIESNYNQAPEQIRRRNAAQREIEAFILAGQQLAKVNLNLENKVDVYLKQNPDEFQSQLRRVLEPAIRQLIIDQNTVLKNASQQIYDDVSNRVQENVSYGFR